MPLSVVVLMLVSQLPYNTGFTIGGIPKKQYHSALKMVDATTIEGAGIAVAGLAAGVGLLAFTEKQGERGMERGGGLSDDMSNNLAGGMVVEKTEELVDAGGLAAQLENALKGSSSDSEISTSNTAALLSELDITADREVNDDGW